MNHKKLPWPDNFYEDLAFDPVNLDRNDLEISAEYVFLIAPEILLKERKRPSIERNIAISYERYKNKKTLQELAEENGITRQACQLAIDSTLQHFANNNTCRGLLQYGITSILSQANKKLSAQASKISELENEKAMLLLEMEQAKQKESSDSEPIPLKVLDLNARAMHCLKYGGITSVQELLGKDRTELLQLRNLGLTTLEHIEGKIREYKLAVANLQTNHNEKNQPHQV